MNEIQIQEEVIRYLDDENYRCAILIDGEWGSGKTYLVLHGLREAIEQHERDHRNREIKYISVYGCKTVEDIEEKVYWSVIDKKFLKWKAELSQKVPFKKPDDRERKERQGLSPVSRKLIDTMMHKLDLNYKTYEYLEEFVSLDQYIMIFDDLERCACPVNEMLGYMNGLVEHEGVKVILVANEQEIGRAVGAQNKELQYLLVSNQELNFSTDEESWHPGAGTRKAGLTPDELEERRKMLFADEEQEQQYQRIREKLIGITIRYRPDFSSIIHCLIENWDGDKKLKEILENHINYFVDQMEHYRHYNFRTFQFFLLKIGYLYSKLKELQMDACYVMPMAEFIVRNCFMLSVEFKGKVQEPEERLQKIIFQQRTIIKSIQNYVRTSAFDNAVFQKEISSYIETELANRLPEQDPYNELKKNYFVRSQKWCGEKIESILDKLQWNEYPVSIYGNIIILFVMLKEIGFPTNIIERAENDMLENIKKSSVTKIISEEIFTTQNKEVKKESLKIIRKINQVIAGSKEAQDKCSIKEILADKQN